MEETMEWSETAAFAILVVLVIAVLAMLFDYFKARMAVRQDEQLRQLVSRYEQLAERTMDAEQRVAADIAELRTRTASIEQILRTVE